MQVNVARNKTFCYEFSLDSIVKEYLPLINLFAYKLFYKLKFSHISSVISVEDLTSTGVLALIESYYNYDPSLGTSFKSFVLPRIKGAMIDEIRRYGIRTKNKCKKKEIIKKHRDCLRICLGREPDSEKIAESMGLTLDDYYKLLLNSSPILHITLEDLKTKNIRFSDSTDEEDNELEIFIESENCNPFEIYARMEEAENLYKAINCLSDVERKVITLHFFCNVTLKEIGNLLNRTPTRMSQILQTALNKMKKFLESLNSNNHHTHKSKVIKLKVKKTLNKNSNIQQRKSKKS